MRLILDGNSILNAALLGGIDIEDGRKITGEDGKTTQVNSAQYGVDKFFDQINTLCQEFNVAPRQMILVWDGKNSKLRRRAFLETYKVGRDKAPEVSEQINIARDLCTRTMLDLGAHVAQQQGYEADDVIGYLCKVLPGRKTVVTSDGDLTVLHDATTDVWRLGKMNENPYGPFPHKYITLYKALVGDTSDKIPGAKGFGDGAWVDMCRIFGLDALEEFQRMIVEGCLHELKENVPDLKVLQKVLDNKEMVTTSWRVASLLIDDINTMNKPLELQAGMVVQLGATEFQPSDLKRFYGTSTLVHAGNFDAVYQRLAKVRFNMSPFVALDIETSASDESDEWVESVQKAMDSDKDRLDVLGHELCGMSLTFGDNTQHTIYMTVDHAASDVANITVDQCRMMCELIPQEKPLIVQNRSFEFSVLYRTWGEQWKDNGWHGFLPNCIDTLVGGSYVDENIRKGLKERSLHHLGYTQATYEATTTKSGSVGSMVGGQLKKTYQKEVSPAVFRENVIVVEDEWVDDDGEVHQTSVEQITSELVTPAVVETWEDRQFKMNQLTAHDVFAYGCDDTICTAALHTHYQLVMEIEATWDTYLAVETLPQYLTSLAYVQGIPVSMPTLIEMERKDDASYDAAWRVLREYLMSKGWEGTTCPEFCDDIEPSDAKLAVSILLGGEFTTRKRKLDGIAFDIRAQYPSDPLVYLLAHIVEQNSVAALNDLIKRNFTGEPQINFGSPKQMRHLFYEVIGMTPRIVNKLTDKERADPVKASAFKKRAAAKRAGKDLFANPFIDALGDMSEGRSKPLYLGLTPEELKALIGKSSTDDTAVSTALAMDNLGDTEKAVLVAYAKVREIMTRRNLFYKTYRAIPHWRDGRIHASLNQSEAVTRRYSASAPNIQQMGASGEGAKLREVLNAHHKDAVVVSLDWAGQELRVSAELSGDEAMPSCFVGDNLRDMHSLPAVSAAPLIWGEEVTYDQFQALRGSDDPAVRAKAKALRDKAKMTNFASLYGSGAASLSENLMISEAEAQSFLDARSAAFPGVIQWDLNVKDRANECGYALTMMGARRHLSEALSSDNKYDKVRAERQVSNFWVQSSSAEMAKLAMSRVWSSGICTDGRFDATFMFPVHDELCFSVHKDHVADFLVEAHACMIAPYAGMSIPLESSIAMGRTFACEVEIGMTPSREAVEKGLAQIFGATQ